MNKNIEFSKKNIFIIVVLLFTGAFCYSSNNFKILSKPNIGLKTSIIVPLKTSMKNQTVSFSNIIGLDFSSLYFDVGISFSDGHSDYVFQSFIKPLSLRFFEFGGGIGYHLYDYYSYFLEQDIISGCYFNFNCYKWFKIQIHSGHILKITSFNDSSIDKRLVNSSWFAGIKFNFILNELFNIYLDFKSTDYYDYPFLGTPFFKLGCEIKCTDNFLLGADYTLKIIDMIAVAETPSEMLMTFYGKINF